MNNEKPLLLTDPYFNLDGGFKSPQEWFEEWERQARAHRSAMLVSLLHWGLKLPCFGGPAMICHYLEVANGHAADSNFGDDESRSLTGVLSPDPTRYFPARVVRRLISEKAWTEVCNKLFDVGDSPYYEPVHRQMLLHRAVADKLLWFFGETDSIGSFNHNLPRYGSASDSNYVRKARTFLRSFFKFAWSAGGWRGLDASVIYGDRPTQEERQRCIGMMAYYHNIRPSLVELMAGHGMLDILRRTRLDQPTRRKLKELALTPMYSHLPKPENLVQAFVSDWGRPLNTPVKNQGPESKYPEAAEILLLYPYLLRSLKKGEQAERAWRRQQEEERLARERAQAEEQLKAAQQRIAELGQV